MTAKLYGNDFPLNLIYRVDSDPFIGAGLKDDGPNKNICNLLKVLVMGNANSIFMENANYLRQSPVTYDPDIIEEESDVYSIIGFTSHKTRGNLSIKCLKPITLKTDGSREYLIRTYNIVRDYKINIPKISALLDENSFELLKQAEIIKNNVPYIDGALYDFNLEKLPVISPAWANASVLRLDLLLHNETILSQLICALKNHAKRNAINIPRYSEEYNSTSLQNYKIYQSKQCHISPASKIVCNYIANNTELELKSCLKLKDLTETELERGVGDLRDLNNLLRDTRFRINCIRMALELHGHAIKWQQVPKPSRVKKDINYFEGSIQIPNSNEKVNLIKKEWSESVTLYRLD